MFGVSAMRQYFCLLSVTFLFGCACEDCAVMSRKDVRSPDGRFVARVMEDTHFDTTGHYGHVSLGRAESFRSTEQRIFSCGPGEPVLVTWTSSTSLVVRYHGYARMPGTPPPPATNVYGIGISFEDTVGPGKSEPDGAANGSQPVRSETNLTSSAAGSRR